MTLNAGSQPLALTNYTRPTPPSKASLGRVAPVIKSDSSAAKRFTVRDGFHLKTRNAEVQAAIDAQITAQLAAREESPYLLPQSENDESATNITLGPAKHEVNSAIPPCKALKPYERSTTNQEDRAKELEGGSDRSAAIVLTQLLEPELVNHIPGRANIRGRTPVKVHAVLKAPADWLIYRDRPSETKHGKQRKIDKLLLEMLRDPQPPKVLNAKLDEVLEPRRSRCQSVLGSTYSERVAAARPAKHTSSEHKHHHRDRLQPLTETERGLLRSREDNNMAVDKLLVSLFHPPSASTQHTATSSLGPIVKTTTPASRFSTRRSIIRHETAVALRSRKLVSRMNELRSLPQLLQHLESLQLWKKQQHIAEHGVDIVARNRANPTLQVLQKPSQTPVLPSATDHKVHQANKRKQELDAAKEENVRRIVVRWQVCREQRAEQARRIHVQSQWLLIVALAESSHTWLTKFHEFRQKRSVLARIIMAKRLQRYWRQRALVKRNSLQLLRFAPSTPLSSAFFRMPVVIHAVTKLQQSIRDWLEQKHYRERKDAISLIVTAWFEFQDVKFRRIILRFRKRVRDFQVMWRAWRAITAARIKLLLLVWAKLERKVKRRHGVTSSHISVTFALGSDGPQPKTSNAAGSESLSSGKGLTLLDMLQRTVIERPLNQPKQLEDMHRHFRNGGAMHMPISAVSPLLHSPTSSNSPSVGFQASPPPRAPKRPWPAENAHVRQDLQLRSSMGEELQLVMLDVYAARQQLTPKSRSPARPPDTRRSPEKTRTSPAPTQQPPLLLPSAPAPAPPAARKVPHQLKVAALRKLLSEKRKLYSDARDRGREAWAAARKQMRSEAFRYDVLDELAAFQRLQAQYATFLLLHSVSEAEMVRLIQLTQEQALAAEAPTQRRSFRRSVDLDAV